MISTKDYTDTRDTLKYIAHVRDGSQSKSLAQWLDIIEFFLIGFTRVFFNSKGVPKTMVQLILSVPEIIKFVRDTARLIFDKKGNERQVNRVSGIIKGIGKND